MSWSYYYLATGLFTGIARDGSAAYLAANCPEGQGVVQGVFDPLRWRVDVATQAVVEHIPTQPVDDALRVWVWDPAAWRWVSAPTLTARKAALTDRAMALILTAESRQSRPTREIALAIQAGTAVPPEAVARLADVERQIAPLRVVIDLIEAAADQAALDAIQWP